MTNLHADSTSRKPSTVTSDSDQTVQLQQLLDGQQMSLILRQWEIERLENQLGQEHPRVLIGKKRLQQKSALLAEALQEEAAAKTPIPDVPEGAGLLHGRITDENGMGIARLRIGLEDEQGHVLVFAGQGLTDASGYCAFVFDAKQLEQLAQHKGIHLVIMQATGRKMMRLPDSLHLAAGERKSFTFSLKRVDIHSL